MVDVLSPQQRSFNMSRIRGRDTKPELLLRRALHGRGFRFRLHRRDLPGRPDLVFPSRRAAMFVHGCFWHGHGCHLSKMPTTRAEFWQRKINGTMARDRVAMDELNAAGWRVLVIWECGMRGPSRLDNEVLLETASAFLRSGKEGFLEIRGTKIGDLRGDVSGDAGYKPQ
jgi:DNA mismatch endonuclease (patch repair protein)